MAVLLMTQPRQGRVSSTLWVGSLGVIPDTAMVSQRCAHSSASVTVVDRHAEAAPRLAPPAAGPYRDCRFHSGSQRDRPKSVWAPEPAFGIPRAESTCRRSPPL